MGGWSVGGWSVGGWSVGGWSVGGRSVGGRSVGGWSVGGGMWVGLKEAAVMMVHKLSNNIPSTAELAFLTTRNAN